MIVVDAYRDGFEEDLWRVYYTAIRQGCANHYSQSQLEAWAPDDLDRNIFSNKIRELKPFIAFDGNIIAGYADIQNDGYIDHFFVHGDHQRKGVGAALMARVMMEGRGFPRIYSNVSNTAKPFFEKYGFYVLKKQLIEIHGQHLENNAMELLQKTDANNPLNSDAARSQPNERS